MVFKIMKAKVLGLWYIYYDIYYRNNNIIYIEKIIFTSNMHAADMFLGYERFSSSVKVMIYDSKWYI